MKKIDIEKLENIREDLDDLDTNEVIFVEEEGKKRYVLMTADEYYNLYACSEFSDQYAEGKKIGGIKFVSNIDNNNLTYEEYENIKKQILDIFETSFKPNPEKLN